MIANDLVFTVNEARKLLKISRGLMYEAIRRGEIPSIHIGRRILIPRVAFERMLETNIGQTPRSFDSDKK